MKEKIINGYRALYLPEHRQAIANPKMFGWVYEHRVVGEDTLGRPLYDDEEVHHLDENKLNNHPENLLILPQSQHMKLHGWMKRLGIDPRNYPTKLCAGCGIVISHRLITFCSPECSAKGRRKVDRPSKEQLALDVTLLSLVNIGEKYGVSDNAIRKWCRAYKINIPARFIRVGANGGISTLVPTQ
ncbi:hypothetical protein [Pseudomonas phage PA1C]|nr:hypothetical protein [Pseudomonas phage PA1C]